MCPTLAHTRQQLELARVLAVSQLVQDRADRQQEEQEKSQTALKSKTKQSINFISSFFFL